MGEAEVRELRRGYAALNRGDVSVVVSLLASEIEWHEPAPSPEAGTHRGRDSFERFLRGWIESFDGFRVEPEQVIERGDQLIAVVRQQGTGRSSGAQVEAPCARMDRGERQGGSLGVRRGPGHRAG